MKFKVDENACIGCGACCSICEEVFDFSSEGFAIAKDEEITDKEVIEKATSAMEGCPTEAISKEETQKED